MFCQTWRKVVCKNLQVKIRRVHVVLRGKISQGKKRNPELNDIIFSGRQSTFVCISGLVWCNYTQFFIRKFSKSQPPVPESFKFPGRQSRGVARILKRRGHISVGDLFFLFFWSTDLKEQKAYVNWYLDRILARRRRKFSNFNDSQ